MFVTCRIYPPASGWRFAKSRSIADAVFLPRFPEDLQRAPVQPVAARLDRNETRTLSAHFNDAFVLVARWMAEDVEARKQMRADMRRHRRLYSRTFMTWMSSTQFMPALVSSSDEGSDDDR